MSNHILFPKTNHDYTMGNHLEDIDTVERNIA